MSIEPEDLVLVSQRGRTFYARVLGVEQHGRLTIAPLSARWARSARLAELRGHWVVEVIRAPAPMRARASITCWTVRGSWCSA